MVWVWRSVVPLAIRKKSVKPASTASSSRMRMSSAFFSSQAAAAAATIWRVVSAMACSARAAGADGAFFFAGWALAATFTPRLGAVFFVVAVFVRLLCFAAVLRLDFLLGAAIPSPKGKNLSHAGGACPLFSGSVVELVLSRVAGDLRIEYRLW